MLVPHLRVLEKMRSISCCFTKVPTHLRMWVRVFHIANASSSSNCGKDESEQKCWKRACASLSAHSVQKWEVGAKRSLESWLTWPLKISMFTILVSTSGDAPPIFINSLLMFARTVCTGSLTSYCFKRKGTDFWICLREEVCQWFDTHRVGSKWAAVLAKWFTADERLEPCRRHPMCGGD